MNAFRKTTSIFFAVFFVPAAVTSLILFHLDRRAFSAAAYQEAFAREDFYDKIPVLMAKSIVSPGTDGSGMPLVMQGMDTDAWEQFIRALLPPETLQIIGDDALVSTFAYLNLETDSAQVSLIPLKSAMAGESGTQAALSLLASLPPCTVEQIAQFTFGLFSGGQIQLCNPPPEALPLLTPIIQGQMQVTAAIIPDSLTLITAPADNDPRKRLQTVRLVMRLSPILPLIFLLTLTVLSVRSLKDWLSWWGFPLAIFGAIAFTMGILGAPVFGAILEARLADYLPDFLLEFASGLAAAMAHALLAPVLWQGLLFALLGSAMSLSAWLVHRREN